MTISAAVVAAAAELVVVVAAAVEQALAVLAVGAAALAESVVDVVESVVVVADLGFGPVLAVVQQNLNETVAAAADVRAALVAVAEVVAGTLEGAGG